MQNPLETSILQTAIAALDPDALMRLRSSLDKHIVKEKTSLPEKKLSKVEIITSPEYREQFITHIANGGDCQNFQEIINL